MSDLMAMEKVIIPKEFNQNTTVDFNNKKLELVENKTNFMFGDFQLMTLKPNKKVYSKIRFTLSKKSSKKKISLKHPI
jgi:hypothetical protein